MLQNYRSEEVVHHLQPFPKETGIHILPVDAYVEDAELSKNVLCGGIVTLKSSPSKSHLVIKIPGYSTENEDIQ